MRVMAIVAALLGGGFAATAHAAKATTRAAINTSPEPFSNVGASLVEDSMVPAGLWLAVAHPLVFGVLFVAVLVLSVWLIRKSWRFLKALFGRVARIFSGRPRSRRRARVPVQEELLRKTPLMFKKILIANRGEIACRVAATARRMAHPHGGRVLRCRRARQPRARLRRSGPPRRQRAQGQLPALGEDPRSRQGHRRAGRAPRLRLPERERGVRAGLRRRRPGLHRPAALGHQGHGPEGRVQAADGKGRRAAGARLPRQRPGPGAAAARGRPHRLPGADQGQRRRRRQGHARGRQGRATSPPRWPRASARRSTASATTRC